MVPRGGELLPARGGASPPARKQIPVEIRTRVGDAVGHHLRPPGAKRQGVASAEVSQDDAQIRLSQQPSRQPSLPRCRSRSQPFAEPRRLPVENSSPKKRPAERSEERRVG